MVIPLWEGWWQPGDHEQLWASAYLVTSPVSTPALHPNHLFMWAPPISVLLVKIDLFCNCHCIRTALWCPKAGPKGVPDPMVEKQRVRELSQCVQDCRQLSSPALGRWCYIAVNVASRSRMSGFESWVRDHGQVIHPLGFDRWNGDTLVPTSKGCCEGWRN